MVSWQSFFTSKDSISMSTTKMIAKHLQNPEITTKMSDEFAANIGQQVVRLLAPKYGFDEETAMNFLLCDLKLKIISSEPFAKTMMNNTNENNDNEMNISLPDSNTDEPSIESDDVLGDHQPSNGPADQAQYDAWVAQQQEGEDNKKIGYLNEEPMNIINATNKATSQRNRGTGAGGANTNRNGLPYEEITSLNDRYTILSQDKFSYTIKFNDHSSNTFVIPKTKKRLFKTMGDHCNDDVKSMHGCKEPDECYIDKFRKLIFILEKKFQCTTGSVCEKIQTSEAKKWNFERKFPGYTVVYVYCLADWFRNECEAELEYLEYKNVPVFWGSSENYKNDIIQFITNYI